MISPSLNNSPASRWISVGLQVVVRDITEPKRAAEALRESEQRFRQLAESISEVFWMSDPQAREVLYVSPAYERVWGRSCRSLYEQPRDFLDAVHPEDRERVLAALDQHGRGQPSDIEYRVVRPDGAVRWIRDRGFPVQDAGGRVYRFDPKIDNKSECASRSRFAPAALSYYACRECSFSLSEFRSSAKGDACSVMIPGTLI